jgi:AcrR family transcriptional regulator
VSRPASIRDQQRTFTYDRLLQAATDTFAKRGYVATTIDDIANEAGASRATFYLHFRNKIEVVIALLGRSVERGTKRYHKLAEILLLDDPDSARQQLGTWLAEWLPVWRDGSDVHRAIAEAAALEPEVEEASLRNSEAYIEALDVYFRRLPASGRDRVRNRALLLEAMTRRAFSLASAGRSSLDDLQLIDFLTDLWWSTFPRPGAEPAKRPRRSRIG